MIIREVHKGLKELQLNILIKFQPSVLQTSTLLSGAPVLSRCGISYKLRVKVPTSSIPIVSSARLLESKRGSCD